MPGVGPALREKITTLVQTGQLPYYEELRKKTPIGLHQMLRLPSMGPKKVKALYDQLGVDTLEKLQAACETGRSFPRLWAASTRTPAAVSCSRTSTRTGTMSGLASGSYSRNSLAALSRWFSFLSVFTITISSGTR